MMRKLLRTLKRDPGQAFMITVLTVSIVFVVGVITIDFGVWFSERRGAQKDADLSALAAAQELLSMTKLSDPNASTIQDAANDRATEYANHNDVNDPDNIHLPDPSDGDLWTACWSDIGDTSDIMDTYPLDIEHPGPELFATIWGLVAPDELGAHARACIGSIISSQGVMPIGVPINNPDYNKWSRVLCYNPDDDDPDDLPEPQFGITCDLSVFDKVSGEAGWLDLDHPEPPAPPSDLCSEKGGGADELGEEIENGGANTWCYVAPTGTTVDDCDESLHYCVRSKTGAQPQTIMKSFETLFSTEGECDITGDGIDDFDGSLVLESGEIGTDSAFFREVCHSPRRITLIIIDNYAPQGQDFMPIRAFASFFVEGCNIDGTDYPKCTGFHGQIGHAMLYGRFINILEEGGVGYPTDWSPKRIILDE